MNERIIIKSKFNLGCLLYEQYRIIKNIDAIINLKEAIIVGVKLYKQILITKKEDPQIEAKIIRSIKLFDTNLFNKNQILFFGCGITIFSADFINSSLLPSQRQSA